MALRDVTALLELRLEAALQAAVDPNVVFDVAVGAPNAAVANAHLVLFPYLITPSAQLRNAARVRPFPNAGDAPRRVEPAVPLDVHYLLTSGSAISQAAALQYLSVGIQALEASSPLAAPAAFQDAVWLSLMPMTSDEMSRIWGLFPNENCRSSIVFIASPVWIDPREIPEVGKPVVDDEAHAGRAQEAA